MAQIQILDCTLRDGGYCNQWMFGKDNIKIILESLIKANIDIVECGFLTNAVDYIEERTKYTTVEQIVNILPRDHRGKLFVAMMNYGEYEAKDIPAHQKGGLDGIRVAFHKKNMEEALRVCEYVKEKGYKVFVQAMVSLSYTDEEFLSLIHKINHLQPYAFYIVDSFGTMKGKELTRLFYMVEHNLHKSIIIGFHSHNNMQLAYSNAQTLAGIQTNRVLIIDSSIYGMGRGAGNLNTELFVEYLNDCMNASYELTPLLTVIDDILIQFHEEHYWGYTLPNYLSAKHGAHPDYAFYLASKQTLTVEIMNNIFSMMDADKKVCFDKVYIEHLYNTYMENGCVQEGRLNELQSKLFDRTVLIVAPGKSILSERDKILNYCTRMNPVIISINFLYSGIDVDYVFASNPRRFKDLNRSIYDKCIITSNITETNVYLKIKYQKILNSNEAVIDNAGMMAIKFLIDLGVTKIGIAGMDGYSVDAYENYADQKMKFHTERALCEARNKGMTEMLAQYTSNCDITFVTSPKHITI